MKVYAILTYDENGNVTGTTGTLQDISELKENFEKYELLANNVLDLVCIINLNARFVYVSPSIKILGGYKPEHLVGRDATELLHKSELNKIRRLAADVRKTGGEKNHIQHRIKTADNQWKWVETSVRIIYNEENVADGIVTCSRIIEERKRAEIATIKALKDAQEISNLKSKFISVVSHEMKTPLTSIYSGVEIMELYGQQNNILNGIYQKQFDIIKTEVDRLNDLTEKILFWGKVNNGKISVLKRNTDMVELVEQLCNSYNSLQKDGRRIDFTVNGEPHILHIDPKHVEHILSNFISNAFKYSTGRPAPTIKLNFTAKDLQIEITDFGIGIPKNDIINLYKSFFRASNAEHIKGNGLGLTIAKHFADLNQIKINIESEEGKQTTVTTFFPFSLHAAV
jgi:PAS domain S-box-containing protein